MDSDYEGVETGRKTISNGALPRTIIYTGEKPPDVLKRRANSPLDFLCLTVHGAATRKGSFRDTIQALKWVKRFRDCEAAALAERIKNAEKEPPLPPACFLVVLDAVQASCPEEQLKELGLRQELVRAGATLVERSGGPGSPPKDSDLIDDFIRGSLATAQQPVPPLPGSGSRPPGGFFNWKVKPPGPEAEMYGRESAHAPLPDNDALKEMFKQSYYPDDPSAQEDLDY